MIEDHSLRVQTVDQDGGLLLRFDVLDPQKGWRTTLSNQAETKLCPWEKHTGLSVEDIEIRPANQADGPLFTESYTHEQNQLVLNGTHGDHQLEERITLVAPNHLSVTVRDTVSRNSTQLERLMSHFYFMPDGRGMGYALPLDFAWLPGLHGKEEHVIGDWFFRSPAAVVLAHGLYAAIVPDLDAISQHPDLPHALDLRSWHHPGSGKAFGQPRLSYGICSWRPDGHVFTAEDDKMTPILPGTFTYGFDLLIGRSDSPHTVMKELTELLWRKYGREYLKDIRPQILPFEVYGEQYTYAYELKRLATPVTSAGETRYGLNNVWRRGANFHAWENDLHPGFGIYHYGCKWQDDHLKKIGEGILALSLSAPEKNGAFSCVYNFESSAWEGSLYWTCWPAYPFDGYDLQAMGVSAWWMLYWHDYYPELGRQDHIERKITGFCRFLEQAQLPSGAIPTYYDADLRPAPQLKESAPTAIGGAVLAKMALLTGDTNTRRAAIAAGDFLVREILPRTQFFDFEVFYSCAPKALHWLDPLTGIPPMNTLAIQWAADHFLALYRLTDDDAWFSHGEYCLSLLSMFQQVWAPNRFGPAYMYGGFGVMNCDGEWNDGRQSRVVPTYIDYYDATGNLDYLERAVAACRAAFAAMDMPENHSNGINDYRVNQVEGITVETGRGLSPESIMHFSPHVMTGEGGGWTGFNWGPGGGLGASAFLERRFGSVWVDGSEHRVVPIDGVSADIVQWDSDRIELNVTNALSDLPFPYTENRAILVKFGRLSGAGQHVTINGRDMGMQDTKTLSQGLEIEI